MIKISTIIDVKGLSTGVNCIKVIKIKLQQEDFFTEELFIEIWHAAQLMHAAAIADKPLVFQKVSKIAFNVLFTRGIGKCDRNFFTSYNVSMPVITI